MALFRISSLAKPLKHAQLFEHAQIRGIRKKCTEPRLKAALFCVGFRRDAHGGVCGRHDAKHA
eukprot:6184482-Pleurochrysis_carterae.AAC.2